MWKIVFFMLRFNRTHRGLLNGMLSKKIFHRVEHFQKCSPSMQSDILTRPYHTVLSRPTVFPVAMCLYQISSDEGYYDRALEYYLQLSWVTQGAHYNLSINYMGQVVEKST